MVSTPRHKVFVSFHERDRQYRQFFAREMGSDFVDKSVQPGDIDPTLKVNTTRTKIRDEFIAEASVTVVLIGTCTWQRKHVDWEIGSSLRETKNNTRCGLLGILLPSHPSYRSGAYQPSLIPPRLADNANPNVDYASIYDWPYQWDTSMVRNWVHEAFERRYANNPDNSRISFARNRTGPCELGWTD